MNNETNVIFYNKFNLTRRITYKRSGNIKVHDEFITKCLNELANAETCPFGGFTMPNQPDLMKVLYITTLASIVVDLRHLNVAETSLDKKALDDFSKFLNIGHPEIALKEQGITLKNGEIHVEYNQGATGAV